MADGGLVVGREGRVRGWRVLTVDVEGAVEDLRVRDGAAELRGGAVDASESGAVVSGGPVREPEETG